MNLKIDINNKGRMKYITLQQTLSDLLNIMLPKGFQWRERNAYATIVGENDRR